MLALSVLRQKPISQDGQGATITLTQADVDSYNSWVAKDGSVALVQAGEQISEYQALQALLLPSANNFADTLATWAFGSIADYDSYVNNYAQQLGLQQTHFVDASGFDPGTVSSASDLLVIGKLALTNPILSDIVSQPSATLPVAGTVYNVNGLLGKYGTVGIKTGNTDQAGGCLLFAAKHSVGDQTVVVIGAVLAAPNLTQSLVSSRALLNSAEQSFSDSTLLQKNSVVATFRLPWGETAQALADDSLHTTSWGGGDTSSRLQLSNVKLPARQTDVIGKAVGSSKATGKTSSVPISLSADLHGPSLWWRLTHPAKTWQLHF